MLLQLICNLHLMSSAYAAVCDGGVYGIFTVTDDVEAQLQYLTVDAVKQDRTTNLCATIYQSV